MWQAHTEDAVAGTPSLLPWSPRLVGQPAGGRKHAHMLTMTAVTSLTSGAHGKEGTTSCL